MSLQKFLSANNSQSFIVRFIAQKRVPVIKFRYGIGGGGKPMKLQIDKKGVDDKQMTTSGQIGSKGSNTSTTRSEFVYYRKPITDEEISTINSGGAWLYDAPIIKKKPK